MLTSKAQKLCEVVISTSPHVIRSCDLVTSLMSWGVQMSCKTQSFPCSLRRTATCTTRPYKNQSEPWSMRAMWANMTSWSWGKQIVFLKTVFCNCKYRTLFNKFIGPSVLVERLATMWIQHVQSNPKVCLLELTLAAMLAGRLWHLVSPITAYFKLIENNIKVFWTHRNMSKTLSKQSN